MCLRSSKRRRGFTLVELLVVIGIIALLISILLPTLGRARRSANTIKCAANIRTILQAMHQYAAQHKGFIPGSPNTSGLGILQNALITQTNCPDISQIWDWQAPLAKIMGIKFNQDGGALARIERFTTLINHPAYTCPENDIIATAFTGSGGPNFPATKWISYNTGAVLLMVNSKTAQNFSSGKGSPIGTTNGEVFYDPPPGYTPKITKLGKSARKIYVGDGARFSTGTPPTMNLDFDAGNGGAYSDSGAFGKFSRAWDRGKAPGNGGAGSDARILSFRHGISQPNRAGDAYRANFGFYDGHVETLGDLEVSNPTYWLPRGTSLQADLTEQYPDAYNKYLKGVPNPYTVPE